MEKINLEFKIWRQKNENEKGYFENFKLENISTDMSFLEALDFLNNKIINETGKDPIAFESDCREGICGACSLVINGIPHSKEKSTTICQVHLRKFKNNELVTIEPFRAKSFKIIKDLIVDRSSLDKIIQNGGYISVNTGAAQEANNILIEKKKADFAFEVASCIGCGACVAACKNSSAALFIGAKITHLINLKQGEIERIDRVFNMIKASEKEGFGTCSNTKDCEAVCPKDITIKSINNLNSEFINYLIS